MLLETRKGPASVITRWPRLRRAYTLCLAIPAPSLCAPEPPVSVDVVALIHAPDCPYGKLWFWLVMLPPGPPVWFDGSVRLGPLSSSCDDIGLLPARRRVVIPGELSAPLAQDDRGQPAHRRDQRRCPPNEPLRRVFECHHVSGFSLSVGFGRSGRLCFAVSATPSGLVLCLNTD